MISDNEMMPSLLPLLTSVLVSVASARLHPRPQHIPTVNIADSGSVTSVYWTHKVTLGTAQHS